MRVAVCLSCPHFFFRFVVSKFHLPRPRPLVTPVAVSFLFSFLHVHPPDSWRPAHPPRCFLPNADTTVSPIDSEAEASAGSRGGKRGGLVSSARVEIVRTKRHCHGFLECEPGLWLVMVVAVRGEGGRGGERLFLASELFVLIVLDIVSKISMFF